MACDPNKSLTPWPRALPPPEKTNGLSLVGYLLSRLIQFHRIEQWNTVVQYTWNHLNWTYKYKKETSECIGRFWIFTCAMQCCTLSLLSHNIVLPHLCHTTHCQVTWPTSHNPALRHLCHILLCFVMCHATLLYRACITQHFVTLLVSHNPALHYM